MPSPSVPMRSIIRTRTQSGLAPRPTPKRKYQEMEESHKGVRSNKRKRQDASIDEVAEYETLEARERAVSEREAAVMERETTLQRTEKAVSRREAAVKKNKNTSNTGRAEKVLLKGKIRNLQTELHSLKVERDDFVKSCKDKDTEIARMSSSLDETGVNLQWILGHLDDQYQCSLYVDSSIPAGTTHGLHSQPGASKLCVYHTLVSIDLLTDQTM